LKRKRVGKGVVLEGRCDCAGGGVRHGSVNAGPQKRRAAEPIQ